MKRLLQYLWQTIDLNLILSADNIQAMHTWVDALYAVHRNMHSHTGGCTSFGGRMVHAKSVKQKINTKSSTKAEVVGVSDYITHAIWTRMFLEGQGHQLASNTLYQDNQSTMKLERNGTHSSGQNT